MSKKTWPPPKISLNPNKRVLFLTKDLDLIRKQLYEGLDLKMEDLSVDDLLDDINTDVMTPAWVCFDYDPSKIAENAYAGLLHDGRRVFESHALKNGNSAGPLLGHLGFVRGKHLGHKPKFQMWAIGFEHHHHSRVFMFKRGSTQYW